MEENCSYHHNMNVIYFRREGERLDVLLTAYH